MSAASLSPSSFFLLFILATAFLAVRADWDPVGDIADAANQTKDITQNVIDGATNAANNTMNAVEHVIDGTSNALNDTKNAAEHVIDGTSNTLNDTKNAAENVINGTATVTNDAYHNVKSAVNGTDHGSAAAPRLMAVHGGSSSLGFVVMVFVASAFFGL